ncbi:MAG: carboxymuconolactone decarboxylase family protein [Jatrophihabitans sp.]|uniref:carboxymuconolactone decarboxylase family protein n=1 Tax=Jatrophihabitans sp. TaxID=1932789 RepID=UPI0039159C5B
MMPEIPPGLAKMNEVYGWESGDFPGDFFAVTRDHLFGEIWTRAGLTTEQRRLLLIGALAATGKHDILDIQLDSAYRLGELDDAALREIVIFLAHYCGWPTAATLNGQVEKLIAKHRKDTND